MQPSAQNAIDKAAGDAVFSNLELTAKGTKYYNDAALNQGSVDPTRRAHIAVRGEG